MATVPREPDLTIIFLTLNKHPQNWVDYHRSILEEATGDYPIITVSREPYELGYNIIDYGEPSHLNMYKQLLRACKEAKTDYIATAEDDALYPPEHFNFFRPPMDTIMYDMARWSLYWWTPVYSVKQRVSNCTLIAPRLEYIDALEEKLSKLHDGNLHYVSEVGRYERQLGLRPRKVLTNVFCEVPTIHFNSPAGTDPLANQTRKRLGQMKAYDIPYWGKADKIIGEYINKNGKIIDSNTS
jgi:hypothetical protein